MSREGEESEGYLSAGEEEGDEGYWSAGDEGNLEHRDGEEGTVQQETTGMGGWDLHRACFLGDLEGLKQVLARGPSREEFTQLDLQGHTALHLAVLRRHKGCVAALLEAGCPAKTKSANSWRPVHEAAATGQRDVALMLAYADVEQQRLRGKEKRKQLMSRLALMPDFSMQLKWVLDSSVPGVGMLLKKFAPNDVYKIWKQGSLIRMDGTLKGVDGGSDSMLPGWKRGHFSIVYDGTGDNSQGSFIDHEKKTFTDLKEVQKKGASGSTLKEAAQKEVEELLQQKRLTRRKMKPKAFRFEPARGWLGQNLTEKVEGWQTKVYEASANMVRVTRMRGNRDLSHLRTFEEYLACDLEPDVIQEVAINPYSPASYKKPKSKSPAASKGEGTAAGSGGAAAALGSCSSTRQAGGAMDGQKSGGDMRTSQEADCSVAPAAPASSSAAAAAAVTTAAAAATTAAAVAQAGPACKPRCPSPPAAAAAAAAAAPTAAPPLLSQQDASGGGSCSHRRLEGVQSGREGRGAGVSARRLAGSSQEGGGPVTGEELQGPGSGGSGAPAVSCTTTTTAAAAHTATDRGTEGCGRDGSGSSSAARRRGQPQEGEGEEGGHEEGSGGGPEPVSFKATPELLKQQKRLVGRCWMASRFPLSLKQILPILQLIGGANKHFYKVESFMSNYADREEFPVRVDIPLILTVSIRLAFKAFQLQDASKPLPLSFFSSQPAGYLKKDPPPLEMDEAADEDQDDLWDMHEELALAEEQH